MIFGTSRSIVIQGVAVCGIAMALAGCASTRRTVGGWFGESSADAGPNVSAGARSTYYAGAAGLKVYSAPASASKVVGTLALHEKVVRSRVDHGYAYVESPRGLAGWVNNGQLIWRLPSTPTGASAASPPVATGGKAEQPDPQSAGVVPAAATDAPAAEPARSAPPPPSAPSPTKPSAPGRAEPSMLDPY